MMCKVRNPSRRGGWRSRGRGAVGRRAAVRGFHYGVDQANTSGFKRNAVRFIWSGLSSFSLVLLLLVFSTSAYAAPSIEVDNFAGYENGETYTGYIVVDAPNEYIATLALIGEYSALPQIDSDMYAKLSNESSGGRFYQLVQEWEKIGTAANGSTEHYVSWGGSEDYQAGLTVVYGYGRVWECTCTDALKSGAKEDFLTILGGGSLGGGGSAPEMDEDYVYLPFTVVLNQSAVNGKTGFAVPIAVYNNWIQTVNSNTSYQILVAIGGYRGSGSADCLNAVSSNVEPILKDGVMRWNGGSGITYAISGVNRSPNTVTHNGSTYYVASALSLGNYGNLNTYVNTSANPTSAYYFGDLEGVGVGDDEPGDNNWPDDDTPQPPAPNPPTPTTPDPDPGPTLPPVDPHDPVVPSPPTNEPAPTGTTPTDYTPWLSAIFQQLVNLTSYIETCFTWLGTALDDHCQHIRDHMTTCFNWLGEYEITGMSNLLGEHHTFLNGLAQWIVDNIKWENSGGEFDDSNMIYWLRRIYARQGAGDVNSRPVDPATDYSGFAGWLGVLYDAVALDVSDTTLTALTSSLSGLQHTFPFSLPWDVRQVLQALDVTPVTPSASIPSGTSGVSYSVDLHWMDSAMVSVRAFELLVFIVYVMVHTKDLFGYLMGE